MEETLTLNELYLLAGAGREREYKDQKFLAALKGIDLDEEQNSETQASFEEVQRKAEAALAGKSEEEHTFADIGIEFE